MEIPASAQPDEHSPDGDNHLDELDNLNTE
jgi:hypothetical protein